MCVCACVSEGERDGEIMRKMERMSKREGQWMCVCKHMKLHQVRKVYVCVCVCVRERPFSSGSGDTRDIVHVPPIIHFSYASKHLSLPLSPSHSPPLSLSPSPSLSLPLCLTLSLSSSLPLSLYECSTFRSRLRDILTRFYGRF